MELRKSKDDTERNELSTRIILLDALVTHLKNDYQISKEEVKECQAKLSLYKKKVVKLKAERGKPEASIVAEIELYLERLNITRAAYHGGDFNGAYCRRLVASSDNVAKTMREILIAKKDERREETTINKKWRR